MTEAKISYHFLRFVAKSLRFDADAHRVASFPRLLLFLRYTILLVNKDIVLARDAMRSQLIPMIRRTSAAKRLMALFLIQAIITTLLSVFALRIFLSEQEENMRSEGGRILHAASADMSRTLDDLNILSKFPVLQAAYGKTSVFDYLSQDNPDPPGLLNYYRNIQAELYNNLILYDNITALGIADLSGRVVYIQPNSIYYNLSVLDTASPLARQAISNRGSLVIAPQEPQDQSPIKGLSRKTDTGLVGLRAIMRLGPFSPVGYAYVSASTRSISALLESAAVFEGQTLSLTGSDGAGLFGPLPDAQGPAATLSQPLVSAYQRDEEGWAHVQSYLSPRGLRGMLRTPLSAIVRAFLPRALVLLAILFVFEAFILLVTLVLIRSIRSPIDKMMAAFPLMGRPEFPLIEDEGADEMHDLIGAFNDMSQSMKHLIKESYQKTITQTQTELQLLRSQINPHFVYNTLETIRASALSKDHRDLADMTSLLGRVLRYGVSRGSEPVTVAQELDELGAYITLQQMHYRGLRVDVHVDPKMLPCLIIKLLLQPLLENAIYHGLSERGGAGSVRILGYIDGGTLVFTVADDGVGIGPEELEQLEEAVQGRGSYPSIGLGNTNRRIQLYYGEAYGLSIRSCKGEGTSISLSIPRITYTAKVLN